MSCHSLFCSGSAAESVVFFVGLLEFGVIAGANLRGNFVLINDWESETESKSFEVLL